MSGPSMMEAVAASAAANTDEKPLNPIEIDQDLVDAAISEAAAAAVPAGMTETFKGLLRFVSDISAEMSKWDGWKLTEAEVVHVATQLELCRQKYFPNFGMGESEPWVGLVMALGSSFGLRFYMFKKHQAAIAEAKKEKELEDSKGGEA